MTEETETMSDCEHKWVLPDYEDTAECLKCGLIAHLAIHDDGTLYIGYWRLRREVQDSCDVPTFKAIWACGGGK